MTKAEADTPTLATTSTTTMSTAPDMPDENARSLTNALVDAAVSEVWYLKPITFAGNRARIITQNLNGSVSILWPSQYRLLNT